METPTGEPPSIPSPPLLAATVLLLPPMVRQRNQQNTTKLTIVNLRTSSITRSRLFLDPAHVELCLFLLVISFFFPVYSIITWIERRQRRFLGSGRKKDLSCESPISAWMACFRLDREGIRRDARLNTRLLNQKKEERNRVASGSGFGHRVRMRPHWVLKFYLISRPKFLMALILCLFTKFVWEFDLYQCSKNC